VTFDFSRLKISTKTIITLLIGFGSLMQIPQIAEPVFAFGKLHPHIASIVGVLTAIAGLLHNPSVQHALGIETTVSVTSVEVAPNSAAAVPAPKDSK
jgi:hypothetical protein